MIQNAIYTDDPNIVKNILEQGILYYNSQAVYEAIIIYTGTNSVTIEPSSTVYIRGNYTIISQNNTTIEFRKENSTITYDNSPTITIDNEPARTIQIVNFNVIIKNNTRLQIQLQTSFIFNSCYVSIQASNYSVNHTGLTSLYSIVKYEIVSNASTQPPTSYPHYINASTFINSLILANNTYKSSSTSYFGLSILYSAMIYCTMLLNNTSIKHSYITNCLFPESVVDIVIRSDISLIVVNSIMNKNIIDMNYGTTQAYGHISVFNQTVGDIPYQDKSLLTHKFTQSTVIKNEDNTITYQVSEGLENKTGNNLTEKEGNIIYYNVNQNIFITETLRASAVYARGCPVPSHMGICNVISVDMPDEMHVLENIQYGIGNIYTGRLKLPAEHEVLEIFGKYGLNQVGRFDIEPYSKQVNIEHRKE